jgi:hypothetical protein
MRKAVRSLSEAKFRRDLRGFLCRSATACNSGAAGTAVPDADLRRFTGCGGRTPRASAGENATGGATLEAGLEGPTLPTGGCLLGVEKGATMPLGAACGGTLLWRTSDSA